MAKPEGYRKAQRLMDVADKFDLPVICFVDTDGAYRELNREARGQAEAIASSIQKCLQIKVPLISVVIGMGGSGGAIAIAAANRILMLENSIYSVISPRRMRFNSVAFRRQSQRCRRGVAVDGSGPEVV